MITAAQLQACWPECERVALFAAVLPPAMHEYGVNDSVLRQAAFLAQTGQESGQGRWLRELASGREYEGRHDLGNVHPGDGVRYAGRGLIMVTGLDNYRRAELDLKVPLVAHPELAEEPATACRIAGWFWQKHGLNELADAGMPDFREITRRINGAIVPSTHEDVREALYHRALTALRQP